MTTRTALSFLRYGLIAAALLIAAVAPTAAAADGDTTWLYGTELAVAVALLAAAALHATVALLLPRPAAVPPSRRRAAVPVEPRHGAVPGTTVPAPLPGWCGAGTPSSRPAVLRGPAGPGHHSRPSSPRPGTTAGGGLQPPRRRRPAGRCAMKPRLLDLFSGAGGAARGYQLAGFHVTGVDNRPQPRYVGDEFVQADALEYLAEHWYGYDAIHASPPCQAYTRTAAARKRSDHPRPGCPNARPAGRDRGCRGFSRTYPVPRCRKRCCSAAPRSACRSSVTACSKCRGRSGWSRRCARKAGRAKARPTTVPGSTRSPTVVLPVVWPWMTITEARQAIPPAYTRFIGERLAEQLTGRVVRCSSTPPPRRPAPTTLPSGGAA